MVLTVVFSLLLSIVFFMPTCIELGPVRKEAGGASTGDVPCLAWGGGKVRPEMES